MNEKQVRIVAVALVIHLIVLRFTWRDLRHRPDTGVRGRKRLWRIASALNTSGSVAYWLFGRRPVQEARPASGAARRAES